MERGIDFSEVSMYCFIVLSWNLTMSIEERINTGLKGAVFVDKVVG